MGLQGKELSDWPGGAECPGIVANAPFAEALTPAV